MGYLATLYYRVEECNIKYKAPRLLSISLLWPLVSNKDHWVKSAKPGTVLRAAGTVNKLLTCIFRGQGAELGIIDRKSERTKMVYLEIWLYSPFCVMRPLVELHCTRLENINRNNLVEKLFEETVSNILYSSCIMRTQICQAKPCQLP